MRIDIKKYYLKHFGLFPPIHFAEIEESCQYELGLLQLPSILYTQRGKIASPILLAEKHREMKTLLLTILTRTYN